MFIKHLPITVGIKKRILEVEKAKPLRGSESGKRVT